MSCDKAKRPRTESPGASTQEAAATPDTNRNAGQIAPTSILSATANVLCPLDPSAEHLIVRERAQDDQSLQLVVHFACNVKDPEIGSMIPGSSIEAASVTVSNSGPPDGGDFFKQQHE